jgi:hypothetical protein
MGKTSPKKARASKRGGSGRKALKKYPRTNPDDLSETVRVDRNDPRYDEWLTPTQARAEKRREEREPKSKGFLSSVGDSIANEAKKEAKKGFGIGKGRTNARTRGKLVKAAQEFVAGGGGNKLVKGAAALGVVGATAAAIGLSLKRAKVRDKAYRLADAAHHRQVEAAKKAGRPMSKEESQRLQIELRRAYITQLEK